MTARELIKAIQDLGEDNLDKEVLCYDEYRYTSIWDIEIKKPEYFDQSEEEFIGIS